MLQQHRHEVETTSCKLIEEDLQSVRPDSQHLQLVTCFAKLSASLCSCIHALSISAPANSHQGLKFSQETLEFRGLWPLLLISWGVFWTCGHPWPAPRTPSDYKLIRETLYQLMNFLLNITRRGSDAFFSAIKLMEPEKKIMTRTLYLQSLLCTCTASATGLSPVWRAR